MLCVQVDTKDYLDICCIQYTINVIGYILSKVNVDPNSHALNIVVITPMFNDSKSYMIVPNYNYLERT